MKLTPILAASTIILTVQVAGPDVAFAEEEGESMRRSSPERLRQSGEEARKLELANLEAYLQSRGVPISKEGIREYLQDLAGPKLGREDARKLIPQLGSESFAERRRAEKALVRLPESQFDLLREAARGSDPQVAFLANGIMEGVASRRRQMVETVTRVMRAIEISKFSGLAEEIFRTAEVAQDEFCLMGSQRALLVTLTAEDFPLLESLIDEKSSLRTIAIRALGAEGLSGLDGVRELLEALWRTGSLEDRLASTEALLAQGNREALGRFATLLESDDAEIRTQAVVRLWGATGQIIAFDSEGSSEERAEQLLAWRKWLDESGSTAEIQTAAALTPDRGCFLVSNSFTDDVVEYDLAGMETWRVKQDDAMACWGIETGERFVHGRGDFTVYAAGSGPPRVLWRLEEVNEVRPLQFGETLVLRFTAGTLSRYERTGKLIKESEITWEGKKMAATDIQPLPNGGTLVLLDVAGKAGPVFGDTYLELDREDRQVSHFPYDRKATILQHLPDGNTLVRLDPNHPGIGSVIEERDPAGKVEWSWDTGMGLRSARILSNGNLLFGGCGEEGGVKEVRPDGSIAWEFKGVLPYPYGISMVYRY